MNLPIKSRLPRVRAATRSFLPVVLLVAALGSTACNGDAAGPAAARQRVAFTSIEGSQPALIIQELDGTGRVRIHFDGVADDIPGNLPPFILPVRDASIRALGPVRWSPDASRLAVVVTITIGQSQVIVMNVDGSGKRTVSANTDLITSDVSWSPDGTRVAYAMTTPAGGVELFVTNVATSAVTRLTTDSGLAASGVSLAWSADGEAVLYSEISQTGEEPPSARISRVNRIEIETRKEATVDSNVPGNVLGISTDGIWALTARRTELTGPGFLEEIVRRSLVDGAEIALNPVAELITRAAITGGENHVLIAIPLPGDQVRHRMVSADGADQQFLDEIDAFANTADISSGR